MTNLAPFKDDINKLDPNLYNELSEAEKTGGVVTFSDPDLGLLVIKPAFRRGGLCLFVWVAISKIGDAITRYMPMIDKMAKDQQAKSIEFETKRKGFKRIAKQHNFTQTRLRDGFFVFTKEVSQ
jgi:hypothetical protein